MQNKVTSWHWIQISWCLDIMRVKLGLKALDFSGLLCYYLQQKQDVLYNLDKEIYSICTMSKSQSSVITEITLFYDLAL